MGIARPNSSLNSSAMPAPQVFPPHVNQADRVLLRERISGWYRAHARDLPWRRTSDPYAIWISEAMLQQTRVETVKGYYRRFLERFATLSELANASEDEVLAAWSGLGYYRRARSLQAAAQVIMREHGGEFPRDLADVLALPGIGPYTAGAVLSIAFDQPEALVDGNVERVFSRLFGLDAVAGSPALVRECWQLARLCVPAESGAGTWNQGLMELGATICTPRDPQCDSCPVLAQCRAQRAGRQTELPRPKPRKAPVDVRLTSLVIEDGGRLLLEQRPAGGRMAGMWQLPTIEGDSASGLFPRIWARDANFFAGELLGELRHSITNHRIRAELRHGTVEKAPCGPPFAWYEPAEVGTLALTGMTRKALAKIEPLSRKATSAE
jgi:A/G-specific adenine glycosylase